MSCKKKNDDAPVTEEQSRIAELRSIPRPDRTEAEAAELEQLVLEERRDRFVRLAPARVAKCVNALSSLGQCASKAGYDYSPAEAASVVEAIRDAAELLATAFAPRERAAEVSSFIDPSWRR